MTRPPFRRVLFGAVALLALAATTVACGSDSDDDSSSSSTTAAASPAIKAPDSITIAYQAIPNGDLIVKQQKLLEKALPDTKITWKLFDSGGSVNEAFASGDIDFGLAGSSPVSRGISQGLPYEVVWIHDVIGDAEALAVKPGIGSVKDLVGKTVATPFASTAHYSLLAALTDADVDPTTVKIIDSEPDDIYAAWSNDQIDGAYVWNPNLAKIVADDGKVLVSSAELVEKGDTTYDLGLVSSTFAEKYPDVVEAWAKAQDTAVGLIQDDVDTAAEIIGSELEIETAEAKAQIGDLIFVRAAEQAGSAYLGGALAENLEKAATFNKEQGEIESVKPTEDYVAAVDAEPAASVGG